MFTWQTLSDVFVSISRLPPCVKHIRFRTVNESICIHPYGCAHLNFAHLCNAHSCITMLLYPSSMFLYFGIQLIWPIRNLRRGEPGFLTHATYFTGWNSRKSKESPKQFDSISLVQWIWRNYNTNTLKIYASACTDDFPT